MWIHLERKDTDSFGIGFLEEFHDILTLNKVNETTKGNQNQN